MPGRSTFSVSIIICRISANLSGGHRMMETLTIGCIEIFLSSRRGKICWIALDNHGVFGVCTFAHDLPDGQFCMRSTARDQWMPPYAIVWTS
jgi:hypothetical protein